MVKTHIIKDSEEEITFCGIRYYSVPLGTFGKYVTEKNLNNYKEIVCKSCLKNWKKWKTHKV